MHACILVHVVCVARRLRGRGESERVGRRGVGGEGVDGRVRGVKIMLSMVVVVVELERSVMKVMP